MKKKVLSIILFIFHLFCSAQSTDDFTADRPGLSDEPDIISRKSWQIECGIDLSKYNHYNMFEIPTSTLRYGINQYLEARLDFGFQYDNHLKVYGVNPSAIGLKALLIDSMKIIPKTGYIIELYPPAFGSTQGNLGLGMELCFSHTLNSGDIFYYNAGIDWEDIQSTSTINALIGYSHDLGSKWEIFGELYYYLNNYKKKNVVSDLGFTWQMSKSLQGDFSFGLDLIKPAGNLYYEFGIAYNFSSGSANQ